MSDDGDGDFEHFEHLRRSIAIVPKVGGLLSLIACTLIMRDVSIKWHTKRNVSLSSLIVFSISVADWLYSLFGAFLSTWMIPSDTWHYLAAGNTQSCTAQGFIVILTVVASMSYYAALMLLFWIIVRFNWSERHMRQRKVQLSFLLPPPIIALGVAIPPLPLTMYNPASTFSCTIHAYPEDCEHHPEVDCVRGEGAWAYWDILWIYNVVCNVVTVAAVGMLTFSVLTVERKTDKYLTKGQEKMRENTRKTFWQGIRYILAFFFAYSPLYILTYFKFMGRFPPPWVYYLNITLTPLLGLFNSFAYFRPRYLAYKERNPDATLAARLRNVFNISVDDGASGSMGGGSRQTSSGGEDLEGDLGSPLFQPSDASSDGERAV
ncbi:hypothetical protein ACHAWF_005470 [Thalassiosira exigua]